MMSSGRGIVDIQKRLKAGLRHVKRTCTIGSGNKKSDIEATGWWSYHLYFHINNFGNWVRKESVAEEGAEVSITWEYEHIELRKNHSITPWNVYQDPFYNHDISPDTIGYVFMVFALLAEETRTGNCGVMCALLLKYLWERPEGIKRIEAVEANSFDHNFLIINREGELFDPDSWGPNAWIVDPWYKEGVVYPAAEYTIQIAKIKTFALEQIEYMNQARGLKGTAGCLKAGKAEEAALFELAFLLFSVQPDQDKYPSLGKPVERPLGYYYFLSSLFPQSTFPMGAPKFTMEHLLKLRTAHKEKFDKCLDEIQPKPRFGGIV